MTLLKDKATLVTGAGSGIGREIALAYVREGARVAVADLKRESAEETLRLLRERGGDGVALQGDVTDPAACESMVEQTVKAFGRLDVACNNAGIGGESAPTADFSIEGWRTVIEINLSSVFYCMKYELRAMLAGGGGAIVNMASILGSVGFENTAGYTAAKHGVVGLTRTAALDHSAKGVRVNAVGPGFIHTPMIRQFEEDEAANAMLISKHPIGRLGRPEEVAELVVWLSSDRASFVTGGYYPVDGGFLAG